VKNGYLFYVISIFIEKKITNLFLPQNSNVEKSYDSKETTTCPCFKGRDEYLAMEVRHISQ